MKIMPMIVLFIILTIFIRMLLSLFTNKNRRLIDRRVEDAIIKKYPEYGKDMKLKTKVKSILNFILSRFNLKDIYDLKLERANSNLESYHILGFQLLVFVLLLMRVPNILVVIFLTAVIGFLPIMYLNIEYNKRKQKFNSQLSKAVRAIANGMKAGYSFNQAFQSVADQFDDPIGTEFSKTMREINFGIDIQDALENLYQRMPSADFVILKSAVVIQKTTGGNLSEILETIEQMIVERNKLAAEIKTLTSQGKMTGYTITSIPILIFAFMNFMKPELMQPLYDEPLGLTILGVGAVMMIVGWTIINKIVTII